MTKDAKLPEEVEDEEVKTPAAVLNFTCERCGYKYTKTFDHLPYLCNRCMRFIAKRVWQIIHTIQPVTSAPAVEGND